MRVDDPRWEHGSDFHYPELARAQARSKWLPDGASFFHSGRDALAAILRADGAPAGRRVFFPSFFCPDVLEVARAAGCDALVHATGPCDTRVDVAALDARAGDVIVVATIYGIATASPIEGALPEGVVVVEDHTHDPLSTWATTSTADYALASLRKSLPVPDGAILWSPRGLPVPPAPAIDDAHAAITHDRLGAMLLKSRYLAGDRVAKDAFRSLAVAGERRMGRGAISGMSPFSRALLDLLPVREWRAARRANHERLAAALGVLPGIELLTSGAAAPFAATLVFSSGEARERVRERLVAEGIYPAVLWDLDVSTAPGMPARHVDLSRRVLSLHCDARYDVADMERVAAAVRAAREDG